MPRPDPSRLTAAQLELMNVLWEHGECSVTFLWERLAETRAVFLAGPDSAYVTGTTMMVDGGMKFLR